MTARANTQAGEGGKGHVAAPMMADIGRQPDVLRGIVARRDAIADFARAHLMPDSGGRTYVFGSGDGWFAARAGCDGSDVFVGASGLEVLGHLSGKAVPADRGLAISMSGNVDRTVEAAEALVARGVPIAALTNSAGGRLAALGAPNHSLDLDDIAPFLCGTASYLATLATLQMARAALDGTIDETAARIARTADALDESLSALDALARTVAAAGVPSGVRILSCGGAGMATADYGAAKLVEVARVPVWTDDVEEFAHRQFWTADTDELIVHLPTTPAVAEIADEAGAALRDSGFRTLWIGQATGARPGGEHQAVPGEVEPALFVPVALQLLAYHLSWACGLDPNTRLHLKNDELRFRTSRRLTRRSLLGTGQ